MVIRYISFSICIVLFSLLNSSGQNLIPRGSYENEGTINYFPLEVNEDTLFWPLGKKGVLIFDVSNPDILERVKLYKEYELRSRKKVYGSAEQIYVDKDNAYLAYGQLGFELLDISDPVNPQIVGKYYRYQPVASFYLVEHYVILGLKDAGVEVIDFADPDNITMVSRKNMEGIHVRNLQVHNNYVYAACGKEGIRIIPYGDPITDFKSAGIIREYFPPGQANCLKIFKGKGFLANGKKEVLVLDFALPEHPAVDKVIETDGKTNALMIDDGFLYIATSKGIEVHAVEDVENIFRVGGYDESSREYQQITVSGNYLYGSFKSKGMFSKEYGIQIFQME